MRVAHDVICTVNFFWSITPSTEIIITVACISYHFVFSTINVPLNEFDVNVVNGIAIYAANDVLTVLWMEVFPARFHQ